MIVVWLISLSLFFFSPLPEQILGELPEHCVFVIIYGVPIYWLTNLFPEAEHFLLNFFSVWLAVYSARAMALWVSALLPTLQLSAFFGNVLFTSFYLSGGFLISLEQLWTGKTNLPISLWTVTLVVCINNWLLRGWVSCRKIPPLEWEWSSFYISFSIWNRDNDKFGPKKHYWKSGVLPGLLGELYLVNEDWTPVRLSRQQEFDGYRY